MAMVGTTELNTICIDRIKPVLLDAYSWTLNYKIESNLVHTPRMPVISASNCTGPQMKNNK